MGPRAAGSVIACAFLGFGADAVGGPPAHFVENRGQWHPGARFGAGLGGGQAFFAPGSVRFTFAPEDGRCAALFLAFEPAEAAATAEPAALGPRAARHHYLRGADPARFARDCRTYERVCYAGVWPGIDVEFAFRDGALEYDLLLAPGADLSRAVLAWQGSDDLALDAAGHLVARVAGMALAEPPPQAFALGADGTRREVACTYRLLGGGRFGFSAAPPAPGERLVIDPILAFSTFLGGPGDEPAHGGALFDNKGSIFAVGRTRSWQFPTTPGAFAMTNAGDYDAFVSKLQATGSELVFSTFIGGGLVDEALAIDVGAEGDLFVCGRTASEDFPTTAATFSNQLAGYYDAFALRLHSEGAALQFSTYLGGFNADYAYRVKAAADGTCLVAGYTASVNFPTTANAYDRTHAGGGFDGFLTRFMADGRRLYGSTLLGAEGSDWVYGLAIDANGDAVLGGYTDSIGFPVTPGALDASHNGFIDAFAARVSGDCRQLLHSTLLGGAEIDFCYGVAIGPGGDVYLAGSTTSADFPTSAGALDTNYAGYLFDNVVTRLSPDLAALRWSTYLGGSADEGASDVAVDAEGRAYVAGQTKSVDYPMTGAAVDASYNGDFDAAVSVIAEDGKSLYFSTFYGGSGEDFAAAIGLEAVGRFYIVGETHSADLPTTVGALDATFNGHGDAFVAKYALPLCVKPLFAASYGTPKASAYGAPSLAAEGIGDPPYLMRIEGGAPGAFALLFIGKAPLFLPFDGGTLLVAPSDVVVLPALTAAGESAYLGPLPSDSSQCGAVIYQQAFIFDHTAGGQWGITMTNGVAVLLGW